jgi:hypothetical protein
MQFILIRNFLQFKPFKRTISGPARNSDDKSTAEFCTSINGATI